MGIVCKLCSAMIEGKTHVHNQLSVKLGLNKIY